MTSSENIYSKIKWLENVYREGKISQDSYHNTMRILEDEIISREKQEMEESLRDIIKNNPTADIKDGRIHVNLKCPRCKTTGANYDAENEFRYLGKDGKGFLYFECPQCEAHLKYETRSGRLETKKFLIGFLGGKILRFFRFWTHFILIR